MTKKDDTVQPGNLVRLKSGGPLMTVNRRGNYGSEVECAWFCEIQGDAPTLGKGWFGTEALEKVVDSPKPAD